MTSTSGKGTVELNNKVTSEATGLSTCLGEQEVSASVVGEDNALTCIKVAVNHRGASRKAIADALTKLTTPPVLIAM